MIDLNDPLTRLAILYGTDKFGHHDYTPNYFKLFKHLKDKPVRILEIGVGGYADDDRGGQSLEVWRDFFEHGEVTGIDIQLKSMDLGPRVKILQGSQVDAEFLAKLVAERGPFDIIVDDGSHRNEHVVESYKLLFPTLKPGGIYVAEDVQTAFHPRFGGSLTLDTPNSVGYFGELMLQLNAGSADPLIRDVAAMERFHNMVAIHKRAADGAGLDVFASNRFEMFDGAQPEIALISSGSQFDVSELPVEPGKIRSASLGKKAKEKKAAQGADIVLVMLDKGDKFDPDRVERLFLEMNDEAVLVIRSQQPEKHFGPDAPLMAYAKTQFTMVDHVEIKVHFPDAEISSLADQIYSIERYEDAVLLFKSPNSYPSNFAFDAANPQAARALKHMSDVLKDAKTEGGLVQVADMLTRYVSRAEAGETLARLDKLGATSRRYYQLAGAHAQNEKDIDRVETLAKAALVHFPNDPQFSVMLSNVYSRRRDHVQAEAVLREAYEANPRARAVVAALARVTAAQGNQKEAIRLARASLNLFPKAIRPRRLVALAQFLRKDGQFDEALAELAKADEIEEGLNEVQAERAQIEQARARNLGVA